MRAVAALRDYRGKVAIVTGASAGIGRLLALRLAAEGARVALVARRVEPLQSVADEIARSGGEAIALPCDVAVRRDVLAAAERAQASFGAVDLLVNNAGHGHHRHFVDLSLDEIERLLQVNLLGSIYWTKAVLPQMIERRRGWIVFMASVAGKIGVPDESVYVASKFALVGLAESLSLEVEDAGVHVMTVCPGAVDTAFFDDDARARMPEVAKRTMISASVVVDATIAGLARGKREVTVPRFITAGYLVRAIAPELMRRNVRRTTRGRL